MAWDDFLDDLQQKAEDAFSNYGSTLIESGIQKLGFITVAKPPKTNLTADQVASGERGVGQQAAIITQSVSDFGGMSAYMKYLPYAIIGGIVLIALLFRRGRK